MATRGKQAAWRGAAAVAIGVLLAAVVAMLIVPLPTWLVDLLITLNLGASVTLLLLAAYAPGPLSIASFPALLVLTTLFRLALNVSTVRLILLQADAGRVVRAFGSFVVRGDYVVGGAVFLILTLVQYLVIARGAERVAEVAARFALDAMPGRQLAIDADLRARAIDPGEARRRREALQREAQLFGSLDGAMRFVKGDAVAALLILVISLAGGLAIGTLRHGMPVAEAAQLYTLLTIGDGLASQIPALLIATAAGLLVTRVASEDERAAAGAERLGQLPGQPRILLAVAALLGALALLPGLPLLPFALVGVGFAALGLALLRRARSEAPRAGLPHLPAVPPPLELCVPAGWAARPGLEVAVGRELGRLAEDLGVPVPALQIRPVGADEIPVIRLHGRAVALPAGAAGAAGAGDPDVMAAAVAAAVRRAASVLVGVDEAERMLEALSLRCPALCREVVPRRIELPALAEVLRRLLAEGVPIGDLREVLEALAARPPPAAAAAAAAAPTEGERDVTALVEQVRRAIAPRLSAHFAPAGRLRALLLDPLVEETVRDALRPGGVLALEPALADEILDAVGAALATDGGTPRPVLLVAADLRAHVAGFLAASQHAVPVLAFDELTADVEVADVGHIAGSATGAGAPVAPPALVAAANP